MMDDMLANGQFAMQSYSTAFSSYFGDSPVQRFIANFVIVTVLGIMTQWVPYYKTKLIELIKALCTDGKIDKPYIQLSATETRNRWSDYFNSGKRFKAWMWKIKHLVKKGQLPDLMVLETKGRWDDEDWIPVPTEDLWQIGESDLWASFHNQSVEDSGNNDGGSAVSKTDFYLQIYTTKEKGLQYLLAKSDEVVKEFEEDKNNELISGPHIFYYQGKGSDEGGDGGNANWEVYPYSSTRNMSHLWFKQKDDFLTAYNNFLENKEIYEKRGDPYTFSCLLYGTPGCGKSSLLKAVLKYDWSKDLKSHLMVIPFSKISSADDLRHIMFKESVGDYKVPFEQRIFVFEDFDASKNAKVFGIRERLGLGGGSGGDEDFDAKMYMMSALFGGVDEEDEAKDDKKKEEGGDDAPAQGPKNKKGGFGGGPSFNLSDILNILDGLNERTGQRCFWTTNLEPPEDHFDPAFLRPGRMDMIIQFTKCNNSGLKYLIDQYYDSDIDIEELEGLEPYMHSPAKLKQFCKECAQPSQVIYLLKNGEKEVDLAEKALASGHRFKPAFATSVVLERVQKQAMGMAPPSMKRNITVG